VERKLVTIVFADLVGSTALADEQDPERTRALLDRFYDEMAAEVEATGGTVEKFVGDAIMAAFGAPTAHEDDAERALHAALAMQRRLDEIDHRLSLRIGVNTGEVVVDRPREGSSFVTGDAVNVAARLEQAAAPGEILAGERTVAAVGGAFEFDETVTLEAKGKPAGVRARRLVRALSLMRPRGVSGLAPVFVGRDAELDQLRAAYGAAVEQVAPRLVTILGDAGVGKTRLARELWGTLGAETQQPLRRTGRCLSYGDATTYWPLGEVLREHFGILENDEPETIAGRLRGREMLGLTLSLDVAGDLHPLAVRDRLQDAWSEFLTDLTAERPLVMLIEDAHWAEDQLLDLLEQLLRDVRGALLLIVTARPELTDRRPGWRARSTEVIELRRLTSGESARMIDELLAAPLPQRIREIVVQRAEGNPFFVEELLGMLIDRGVLERANGSWKSHDLPLDLAVPDSVQAVLAARIDFLGPAEKAALQAASVIGRIFWAGPVYELVEGAPDLRALEERDLIFRRPTSSLPGDREYAIKHALTRDVAYASLPKAKRARMHAAFADWIARTGRDEHAPLLAHHYAKSVRPEDVDLAWTREDHELERLRAEARRWLRRAATLAIGRYEIDDGIDLLKRALELGPSHREESELWREIGRAHALKFEGEAFWTAMQKSLEVCFDRATCAESYAELALQTACRSGMWRRRPDDELVEGWIERALELSEPESAARAKGLIAASFWNVADAMPTAVDASAIADRLSSPELRSMAWSARSLAAFRAGDYDDAITWAQRSFDLVEEIPDPDLRADVYWNAILPCVGRGRFREARRLALGHDEINDKLTAHHRVHGVAVLLEVEELVGAWDRVRALEERARETVEANLETPCVRNARALLLCAIACFAGGDEDGAERLERRAEEIALHGYGVTLDAPRARLALLRGDLGRVERLLSPTGPSGAGAGGRTFYLGSQSTLLDGLAATGDRERVEAEAPPLLKPKTYLEPFAQRALGIVRQDDELVRQAQRRFEELRLHWYAGQTPRLLELQA
jgi:class 3 adenylate cyclase